MKPSVLVSNTRYFISLVGPFFAKINMRVYSQPHHEWSNNEDIRSWIQNDVVFIVDRGFHTYKTLIKNEMLTRKKTDVNRGT